MQHLFLKLLIILICGCSITQRQTKKEGVLNLDPQKIVAQMDDEYVLPRETAVTIALYKDILANVKVSIAQFLTKQGNVVARSLGGDFISVVKLYLETFTKDGAHFKCHITGRDPISGSLVCLGFNSEKQNFVKMRLFGRKRDLLPYLSNPKAYFAIHFCAVTPGEIKVARDDWNFWQEVKDQASLRRSLYGQSQTANLNGMIMTVTKESGQYKVSDYRVSIGPIADREERSEFLDEDCIYYKKSKSPNPL